MKKLILSFILIFSVIISTLQAQACEITAVNATILPCNGSSFSVSINLEVSNPSSPGFTLAGNGVVYGTYLYSDLPVTVGPLLGDDSSVYEFIAWDVENADCQQFTTIPAANCGPICSISNFTLDFVTCISNQSAIVVFDFDHQNPGGNTFDLYNEVSGADLGTWLYESLPVTLPFFAVNGASPIVLTVCDHSNNSCCETFTLDAIDCNPNNCELFSLTADPECTGTNFVVHLNFGYDNPASDSFNVVGNNINYGTFAYTQLPITIGPLNGGTNIIWQFNVSDSELGSCNTNTVLGIYHCPPPCNIQGLEAMALECNGNEAYALEIGLDIEGEGDLGFAVFSETSYYGSHSYNELPITLPAFEGSGEFVDIVSVCDNQNPGCCATTPFEALLCSGCLIYNLTATALPCNSEGQIFVQIDFDHQNVSGDGFEITGNGNNYGQFSYDALPVQVGPFVGDGSQYFEFVVTDLVDQFCFSAVELGYINCQDICELSNLVAEPGACTGNGTYVLHVDFDFQGTTGIGFDLYANGEPYGFYSYADLPLTLEEFPASGTEHDTLTVCENDNSQCCATIVFESPGCQCHIYDTNIQNIGCTSDSTFGVSLEFFYENLPDNTVDVFLDGVPHGSYNVADIPLLINIPEGDGTAVLSVCANDLNNCCDEVLVDLMNCETPTCTIWDLVAEPGDCNSDSTFLLDIVFNHSNLPTDSVAISANDQFLGNFKIQPDFIRIEHFPVFPDSATTLTVCALGDTGCCDTFTFVAPDCSLFGQCHIWDLVTDLGDCNSDSTYLIHIHFNYQNLPSDSVVITGNGNNLGTFLVNPENITIEHFPIFDSNHTILTVCAAGAPDCCGTLEFETPDCSLFGQCQITDLLAAVGPCTSDSTYILHVDFNGQNLPSDSVVITANGNYIGQFFNSPENITIEHFPVFDTNHTVITVCAVGSEECCAVYEYETPDCSQGIECLIHDLVATVGDCQSDSTFAVNLSFLHNNIPTDSVVVYSNDFYVGQYLITPDFIHIEDFPILTPGGETIVSVCAVGAPDCCDTYTIVTPYCNGECVIYAISVNPLECNSDSTFAATIQFHYENISSGGFDVYSGNQYLGFFNFEQLPIQIPHFPSNQSGQYVVTICESDSTLCCATQEFEGPACGIGGCHIFNLEYAVSECDSAGNFYFNLNFDFSNTGSDGFNVTGNGNNYGNFSYENLPVQIGPFPSDDTPYEFHISDVSQPDCFATITPGVVNCTVATKPVDSDKFFQVFNNGTIPGIYARKNITLSLFNSSGKMIMDHIRISQDELFELNDQPSGLYIGTILYAGNRWPVKLVKAGY